MIQTRNGIEKRDMALVQIRRAIQLYRKADFICAATLAGAAEEVLGRIAKNGRDIMPSMVMWRLLREWRKSSSWRNPTHKR